VAAVAPLFVELCAGLASLSLVLQGGRYARPPVSRMGSKTGYALPILHVMGLRAGQGAERYLWCEPDPGCRALLHAYTRVAWLQGSQASGKPLAVGADGRMNALRGDGNGGPTGAGFDKSTTIEGVFARLDGTVQCPASVASDAVAVDPREVARWALLHVRSFSQKGPSHGFAPAEGNEKCIMRRWRPDQPAPEMSCLPTLPASVASDAVAVDPREVARWSAVQAWTIGGKNGFADGAGYAATAAEGNEIRSRDGRVDWMRPQTPEKQAAKHEATPTLPASVATDARDLAPVDLPPGTVVYIDPPYQNTTGYAHDLPRAAVVDLARRWHAAGARVYISEAEPLPELTTEGWHAVEITSQRRGQKRTFSKQQREWLTCSHPPAWTPPVQRSLF